MFGLWLLYKWVGTIIKVGENLRLYLVSKNIKIISKENNFPFFKKKIFENQLYLKDYGKDDPTNALISRVNLTKFSHRHLHP